MRPSELGQPFMLDFVISMYHYTQSDDTLQSYTPTYTKLNIN